MASFEGERKFERRGTVNFVEIHEIEDEDLAFGPLSLLTNAVQNGIQILINCRDNKKILGEYRAHIKISILCILSFPMFSSKIVIFSDISFEVS